MFFTGPGIKDLKAEDGKIPTKKWKQMCVAEKFEVLAWTSTFQWKDVVIHNTFGKSIMSPCLPHYDVQVWEEVKPSLGSQCYLLNVVNGMKWIYFG